MDDQPAQTPDPARVFGGVVDAYDRGRPGYPAEAVRWMTSPDPVSVLELGAGTGKLTEQLVALGHVVHAIDPDDAMLSRLEQWLPGVRTDLGAAESIPAPDSSYDVVIAAQCFHWFDPEAAIPEIVRVLKPGGRLALTWNQRDERIPWVKKLGRLIGTQHHAVDPTEALEESMKFIMIESERFKHWQLINRRSIWDLAQSRSDVATLDAESQESLKTELLEFYDGYGRGMDGMQLPYLTRCFRGRVVKSRRPAPAPAASPDEAHAPARPAQGPPEPAPADLDLLRPLNIIDPDSDPGSTRRDPHRRREDDTVERVRPVEPPRDGPVDHDDGMLLIDFR